MVKTFSIFNLETKVIDLTGKSWKKISKFRYSSLRNFNLLIASFPIYAWRMAEPIERFLINIPRSSNCYGAILASYGGVAIGKSLIDAGKLLIDKGYALIAAAKIVAKHSTVFNEKADPFNIHPSKYDLHAVETFTKLIVKKASSSEAKSVSLKKLNSNSKLIRILSNTPLASRFSRKFPPGIKFNPKKCMKCELCAKACPVNIIKLDPYPTKLGKCIRCHNCERVCPYDAIDTTGIWRKYLFHIGLQKILLKTGGERPWSQIFV